MSGPPWKVALASVAGTSHARCGVPCQDACLSRVVDGPDGEVLVAAVSDGAGSAARSEVGSSEAVRALVDLVAGHVGAHGVGGVDEPVASAWVASVAGAIAEVADASGHPTRDYACTLLCAVVGRRGAAFLQVGDGAIVARGADGAWRHVFWPQHGEYANTTNFVTSPGLASLALFEARSDAPDEVALFTDGIENLVLHRATRSAHQPFFDRVASVVSASTARGVDPGMSLSLASFLRSDHFDGRTDDDKSLVVASRVPAAP